jgi:hypothetical protein
VRRLEQILQLWRQTWPVGKWLLTTDAWLRDDYWIEYDGGVTAERSLFSRTVHRHPQLSPDEHTALTRILRRTP